MSVCDHITVLNMGNRINVSILVLVDVGLRYYHIVLLLQFLDVSILVLVDVGLRYFHEWLMGFPDNTFQSLF